MEGMTKSLALGLAAAVLVAVALIYLPVMHADFVWDDWPSMRDLQGDRWLHYVFRDFNNWVAYFRPLCVAFLALQIKLFHGAPAPMHGVSLALHLVNVGLLGLLALRTGRAIDASKNRRIIISLACMLIYGVHPALIEPVAWVGLQADLLVTMLTLCALLATSSIENRRTRAAVLAGLFFLAACAKESASTLPLLVVLFDWILYASDGERRLLAIIRTVLRRNWLAYVGMLVAGVLYLILRHWALGNVDYPATPDMKDPLTHFQEVCFIYLNYLRIIVWPISGMNPLHVVDVTPFGSLSVTTLLTDAAAIAIVANGFYLAIRRGAALGFIILAATTALLPVIRILPVSFERSLYHERYAMLAVTMVCALLPLLKWPSRNTSTQAKGTAASLLVPIALFFWLAFSIIDIRVIVPKWRNDTTLWEWALAINPDSAQAKDNLLSVYIQTGDLRSAQTLADRLLTEPNICASCMLHLARIALNQNDLPRAATALDRAAGTLLVRSSSEARQLYYAELGKLLVMQGRYPEATQALSAAIALKPDDAEARQNLAKAAAMQKQP